MTDCAFALNGMAGAGFLAAGVEPQMENQALNGGGFYDYYRSRDGRWFAVGSLEPQFMQQLCAAIGRPELASRGLSAKADEQQALKREIAIEFEKRDFADWCKVFAELDACVEPMLTLSEATEHPQLVAREAVCEVPRASNTPQRQIACPIKFSAGLPAPRHIGAALGTHTDEVLAQLGCSPERIAALRAAKVVG